jgi:predicted RNA-binding protein YlxR (DUF448 family)
MCALTRHVRPEAELIRFVAAPDGSVVADLKARLPGRGVWVGLDRNAVSAAVRKNVFARGLKRPVLPAADLADQVAKLLRKNALGRLGLARKAGEVVTGFAKVEGALAHKEVAALVIAAGVAEDGRRKIERALRRRFGDGKRPPVFRCFASAELGLATGGAHVIHAAVLQGPAGRGFVEAADRLRRYHGAGGGEVGIDAAAEPRDMTDE